MVIPEQFVGGAMVKLGLESFLVPRHLVIPEGPQPGEFVIKLNRRSMLKALVKQVKWTEVRSRTVDQTEKACLFRWTWVWFARTAAFKDGGETVDLCEVWGGAWYLGESGPVNPQDEGVVAILQSWHAQWPTTHGEILRLIESMGPQCGGYRAGNFAAGISVGQWSCHPTYRWRSLRSKLDFSGLRQLKRVA